MARRFVTLLVIRWLAGSVLFLLAACGSGDDHSLPETQLESMTASSHEEYLRVAIPATPVVTDPRASAPPFALSLVPYLYPSLLVTTRDSSGATQVRGDLATRWTWHAEDHRLVLDLDPRRRWSHGGVISEADVLESRQSGLLNAMWGGAQELVDAVSPQPGQVALLFAETVPEWRALEIAGFPILPIEELDPGGTRAGRGEPPPIGGLMRVAERDARRILLLPNETGPKQMRVPGVVLEVVSSADTRLLRVSAGLSDVALDIPIQVIRDLGVGEDVFLHDAGPGSVEMLCWNLQREDLPPAFREAVSLAIDRSHLAEIVCHADTCYGGPANGLMDPAAEPVLLDRARAERLLAPDTLRTIRMLYDRSNEVREQIATYLEEDLARVGIHLHAVALDGPEVVRRFRAGEFEVALLGFLPSASPDCGGLWTSGGQWNGMSFRDARVDSLCARVRQASRSGEAQELILEIEAEVRRKMPVTFLVHRRRVDAISRQVSGFAGTTWQPLGPLEDVTRLRASAGESRMTAATPREEAR